MLHSVTVQRMLDLYQAVGKSLEKTSYVAIKKFGSLKKKIGYFERKNTGFQFLKGWSQIEKVGSLFKKTRQIYLCRKVRKWFLEHR